MQILKIFTVQFGRCIFRSNDILTYLRLLSIECVAPKLEYIFSRLPICLVYFSDKSEKMNTNFPTSFLTDNVIWLHARGIHAHSQFTAMLFLDLAARTNYSSTDSNF